MAKEALMRSEQLFRALIEQSADAIILLDPDGTIIYAGPSTTYVTGYAPEELVGMNSLALIHPDDQGHLKEQLTTLMEHAGEALSLECRLHRKDGTWQAMEGSAVNLLDHPQVGAIVCTCRDITRRTQHPDGNQAQALRRLEMEKETLRQAAQEAQARADRLTAIFEAMTDGVVAFDGKGRITHANAAFRTLFDPHTEVGSPSPFPGADGTRAVPYDQEERACSQGPWSPLQALSEEYPTGQQTLDFTCRDRAGQQLVLNVKGTPIRDAAGQIVGGVAVYRDVTEQHQLEQQLHDTERKYRSLVESNIVGVMMTDQEGRMYEVNDRLVELLGYSREELLNGNMRVKDLLLHDFQAARVRAWKTLISHGASLPEEKEYMRKDGGIFPALVAAATINQERTRALVMLLDISDQREAERRKEEFLSMVSHELRTPLTAVQGFLDLALLCIERLSHDPGMGSSDLLGTLETMLHQAQREAEIETRLVADLLDASRMEMQKFELSLQPHNLTTIVQLVVANQQRIAPTHRLELDLPPQAEVPVVVDADRIEQVLTNFLSNAFKYSRDDQAVRVQLSVEGLMARVSVYDQGPGLTVEQQQHVWDRFYQAEATGYHSPNGGLGLGLYIVRTIIAQHQGQVGVESRPGQGATFWFLLPLADEPA